MDGYQCSEMIRAYLFNKGVDQPIIVAMTGHTEHKYIERALKSGMNMVMFKPCNQFDLKRVINDIGFEIIKPAENRLESLLPVDTEIIEFICADTYEHADTLPPKPHQSPTKGNWEVDESKAWRSWSKQEVAMIQYHEIWELLFIQKCLELFLIDKLTLFS